MACYNLYMAETPELLKKAEAGFATLEVGKQYQEHALEFLEQWLTDEQYADYVPQIEYVIEQEHWNYLLDSFYQIIPFGTGGRRGEVGIGPNRINPWTIRASAQGHSQYLIKQYGEEAKRRGVVFTYDVREFFTNKFLSDDLPNPVRNQKCGDLAEAAAEVYTANDIVVYMFDDIRTTPELSFAIRHLNAIAGDMFSASHNPPDHNGKKVYDQFGGQLVPPDDEALVDEVTKNVTEIKHLDFEQAKTDGLIKTIGEEVDQAYLKAATSVSLSDARDVNIVYTPLHGAGLTSVYKALQLLGFKVTLDPKTKNPSGKFENVTFNIPNPEVVESFETTLEYAKPTDADIILNSDPDADRIGVMVKHNNEWRVLDGNETTAILAEYATTKRKDSLKGQGILIKTTVTTNLLKKIAEQNDLKLIGDLLVGFKYVGTEMNRLEKAGEINNFLVACEESNGYLAGNYARDKDGVTAGVWLSELAAELKADGKTLIDYLTELQTRYGYFRNYLTEIRMLGAVGFERIRKIQDTLRQEQPKNFGRFKVEEIEDCLDRKPIVSETDRLSKDVLIYRFKPVDGTTSIRVTVRPSGTEPKTKMYFEIGSEPTTPEKFEIARELIESIRKELEHSVMKDCYKIIGVDFPDRGFLLFWQLPLDDKLKYFEIEPSIAALKDEPAAERQAKLDDLLEFLGSDPIEKVDKAFTAEYGKSLTTYLNLSDAS